jgi:CrcB protein
MSVGVIVAVAGAGAIGALLRYGVSLAFATADTRHRPPKHLTFPRAVLVVNVVGSAVSGGLLAVSEQTGVSADLLLVLVTGLCGGLTTFSTWSVETMQLVIEGRMRAALASVWLNLVLGLAAAALCYFAVLAVIR